MRILPRHVFLVVLFGGIFIAALRPVGDPDFWWHLQTGKLIAETGTIPHSDLFSYSVAGKEWITHEWLSEAAIYLLYCKVGMVSLIAVFSAVITAAFYFAFLRASDAAKPYIAGFVVIVSAVASAPLWGVRPQMISLLLTSVFLYLLDDYEKRRKIGPLIALPLITVIWVNLHAGFILGIGIIGIYLGGNLISLIWNLTRGARPDRSAWRPILQLGLTVTTCAIAALINPNTYKILVYPFQTLTDPAMQQYIVEWYSPDFHNVIWLPFGLLVLALIGFGMAGKRPVSITRILLVLVAGFAAFRSVRHIPLFAITAAPILADMIGQIVRLPSGSQTASKRLNWVNLVLIAAVLGFVGISIYQLPARQAQKEAETFPQNAVAWILENHPKGRLFNSYTWGGYLVWSLYPDYPVYIDGRADVYGPDFFSNYASISSVKDGWETKLQDSGASLILVEDDSSLAKALSQTPQWRVVYKDDLSIIFQK